MIESLVTAALCLSLTLLTGFVGQVSLVQAAFAGVGGFMLAKTLAHHGLPFPVALLVAGLAAVPLGLVIGIPALRIRGINLAIITLGAAVALDSLLSTTCRCPVASPGRRFLRRTCSVSTSGSRARTRATSRPSPSASSRSGSSCSWRS